MKIHIHQTQYTIGDFNQVYNDITSTFSKKEIAGIHIYPELFLTGYPLQDLCLQKEFISKYQLLIDNLNQFFLNLNKDSCNFNVLLGGLDYEFEENGLPKEIRNIVFQAAPGKELIPVYTKNLLPNYDIYDEKKYFTPGTSPTVISFNDLNIGIMICEDMWPSSMHLNNPIKDLKCLIQSKKIKLDLLINLSASPFHIGKSEKRIQRGVEISNYLEAPFVYVNKVGSEDEIIFDGQSFLLSGQTLCLKANRFESDYKVCELPSFQKSDNTKKLNEQGNTWEDLFSPALTSSTPPILKPLTDNECQTIISALGFSIQEYASKTGFNNFIVALSGGIDSALVLAILHLTKKQDQKIEALFMPGKFSTGLSYDLSFEMCQRLELKLHNLSIKFLHSATKNAYLDTYKKELEGVANENIQSRLRGAMLYARSNHNNSLVINTSNKSEIAVGYSTLYGDSVGALSILGDLYKSEVFQLANYINNTFQEIIPPEIISRPPSAELREDQEDLQTLPPYERLDPMLEGILSYRLDQTDLENLGFIPSEVSKIYKLHNITEYKRKQFCPIVKLRSKSFGFGRRIPICKKF